VRFGATASEQEISQEGRTLVWAKVGAAALAVLAAWSKLSKTDKEAFIRIALGMIETVFREYYRHYRTSHPGGR
jgi:hypothetical protein